MRYIAPLSRFVRKQYWVSVDQDSDLDIMSFSAKEILLSVSSDHILSLSLLLGHEENSFLLAILGGFEAW